MKKHDSLYFEKSSILEFSEGTSFAPGVGTFNTQSTPGGPAFVMSSASWITLQSYLAFVKNLPSTTAMLQTEMGTGAPASMTDFDKLISLYVSMQTDGTNFTASTYPDIVNLASDIYNYGISIPTYYGGLQECINILKNDPGNVQAQQNLIAVVDQLATNVAPYITKASKIKSDLATFVSNMETDNNTLTAPISGYYAYYDNEYGADSAAVQQIVTELSDDHSALDDAQAKYKRDVIIASTSPAYLWIPVVGWIAAPIIAGVFGNEAVQDLKKISDMQTAINQLEAEKAADALLMQGLIFIKSHITTLSDEITSAVTIVEGIEGNWNAIAADLNNLSTQLQNNFTSTLAFLLQLNFNLAIQEWTTLAGLADVYRENAFITVQK